MYRRIIKRLYKHEIGVIRCENSEAKKKQELGNV